VRHHPDQTTLCLSALLDTRPFDGVARSQAMIQLDRRATGREHTYRGACGAADLGEASARPAPWPAGPEEDWTADQRDEASALVLWPSWLAISNLFGSDLRLMPAIQQR
jgi:hypothetical protein